jgi:hypothetical protein
MSPRLQVTLDQNSYTPGDTVKGTIVVLEGGASHSLEARLEYNEETHDYHDIATSFSSGLLHQGDLVASTSFEFELEIPAKAFPNYRSEHGELYWQIDVKSEETGRDTHERRRIEIEPVRTANIP